MDKDRVFEIVEVVDLDKNAYFSLVDEDLKDKGVVVIKDSNITVYLNLDSQVLEFEEDYKGLLRFIAKEKYRFIKLNDESRWVEFNPNPLGKNVDDCSIRSYCAAKNLEWDDAFNLACEVAEEEKDIINSGTVCHKVVIDKLGMKMNKKSSKVKPKDRPTIMEFACTHPNGIYIVDTGKHFACVKDGYIYDSFCSSPMKVKKFYEFNEEEEE